MIVSRPIVILIVITLNSYGFSCEPTPQPKPQLDLPPLPPASSAKPQLMLGSYAEGRDHSPQQQQDYSRYDNDRSNRFGPPYSGRSGNDDDSGERNERVRERERERERERDRDRYNGNRNRDQNGERVSF